MKIFRIFGAVAMLLFAAVQYNDPDPIWWMIIYGMTGVMCLLSITLKSNFFRIVTMICGLLFLVYSAYNWPSQWLGFDQTNPPSLDVEQARESVGLIIAAALLFIAVIKRD